VANTINIPRSHLIMGLCLPLAVLLGYLLAEPLDSASLGVIVFVLVILGVPLLMKWHHPLLILSWNACVNLFFLPGSPGLWMVMAFASLLFGLLSRSVNPDNRFIYVPTLVRPLLFLLAVVLVTAFTTGGLGVRALGAERFGGRGYFFILAAVAGFFAFTSGRVPKERVGFYLALFFLGSTLPIIGTLSESLIPKAYYLQLLLSSDLNTSPTDPFESMVTHIGSLAALGHGIYCILLARYGLRGVLDFSKPWRGILFLVAAVACLACGFRGAIILLGLMVILLIYLEGLHRTQLLPLFLGLVLVAGFAVLPFAKQLPPSMQRTLSFLPVEIDPVVRQTATASSNWRIEIWKTVLPQVPRYLIKGKGYGVSPNDLYMTVFGDNTYGAVLNGDYHSGPLTLIIPFGIFGVIGFGWFVVASLRYLLHSYRFGDPNLRTVNTFLLAAFIVQVVCYLAIFGNFYTDLPIFVGLIGLSVSLNGELLPQTEQDIAEEALEPAH